MLAYKGCNDSDGFFSHLCRDGVLHQPYLHAVITQFNDDQARAFDQGVAIEELLAARTHFIDQLLGHLWRFHQLEGDTTLTFVATGGYGRGELHPLSDIDLLVLTGAPLTGVSATRIGAFIAQLWDSKIAVNHAVRTVEASITAGLSDVSVATSLLESRLLFGNRAQFVSLQQQLVKPSFWCMSRFLAAKMDEQRQRHRRYDATDYGLEPDIKNSVGGLRDLHTILWLARRHVGATSFSDMVRQGIITPQEQSEISSQQSLLWRFRFALHLGVKHSDNRLLLARQQRVAQRLRYSGTGNQPVEQMMKAYYLATRSISRLNTLLLQYFDEQVTLAASNTAPCPLNRHFQLQNGILMSRAPVDRWIKKPEMLFQLFHLVASNNIIRGIHSTTLRQLHDALLQQTCALSTNRRCRHRFLALLRLPQGITRALLPMHQLGLLWHYMPSWSRLVGHRQFDLFHAHTVDEHTLRVLLALESFTHATSKHVHPLCHEIWPSLPKPACLLLAALLHDIGKGGDGDHAVIGAQEAAEFVKLHAINPSEGELIVWLVRNHALMSITAQRRDIADPDVILQFAQAVDNETRLNYLLCLTEADLYATNERLWNGWKQGLLYQLFFACRKTLRQGKNPHFGLREQIRRNCQQARARLQLDAADAARVQLLWRQCQAGYLLRHTPSQIAWHTRHLLSHTWQRPLVLINAHATHGGTEIFICAQDRALLFAQVVSELDRRHLTVVSAQIFTTRKGIAMDTFVVLDMNGAQLTYDRQREIAEVLTHLLQQTDWVLPPPRRCPAHLRSFEVTTKIRFLATNPPRRRTYMELTTRDQPGLLACIGTVFAESALRLQGAHISTCGEQVKDHFILTTHRRQALDSAAREHLKRQLIACLATSGTHSA